MANIFDLGVEEDDTEELLEVTSEELTIQKLLKLEQECTAEEKAKEKKTVGKEKEESLRKFKVKGMEDFADLLNKGLKFFENMKPNTEMFSLRERNVGGTLSVYMQICNEKGNKPSNSLWTNF